MQGRNMEELGPSLSAPGVDPLLPEVKVRKCLQRKRLLRRAPRDQPERGSGVARYLAEPDEGV